MIFQLLRITVIVLLAAILLTGCGRGAVSPETPDDMAAAAAAAEAEAKAAALAEEQMLIERTMRAEEQAQQAEAMRQAALAETAEMARAAFANEDVHFAFDSFLLDAEAERILAQKAGWLQDNPAVSAQIEGHCDERGTSAYNLALGERRANAVQQYLTVLGIGPGRLSTISYGEEQPLDPGHDEAAWSRNRRAHFVIVQ